MKWIAFSYSLPTDKGSNRVAVWRRLRRLGVVALPGGVNVLPANEECLEAFQWLAEEIRQAGGEALLTHVEAFAGWEDAQIIELFRRACREEYAELEAQATALQSAPPAGADEEALAQYRETLRRLFRRLEDTKRTDYFHCAEGLQVAAHLERIQRLLRPVSESASPIAPVELASLRNRVWVTRPHPYVDRLACIWLIRRYVDDQARIEYADAPQADQIAFDMEGAAWSHRGNLCTFEVLLAALDLRDPALDQIARIVHEIDLGDESTLLPEVAGVRRILDGWVHSGLDVSELERRGAMLYEALYQAFKIETAA